MATSVCVLLVKCFGRMTTTGQQRPWQEKVIQTNCGSNVLELSKIVEQPQPTKKPWLVPDSLLIPPNPASRPFPRLDHAAVLLANGKNSRAPWYDGGGVFS